MLEIERERRCAAGLPVINLSESNPTKTGLVHEAGALAEALSSPENAGYRPEPKGLRESREALAFHLAGKGLKADPARLFLCASTSEGYSYLFKLLCDPGDAVLVPKPGYPLFDHLCALEAVRAVGYRLEYSHPRGWRIDFHSIRKVLESEGPGRVKAIVLINPNNPTGSFVRKDEMRELLELCSDYSLSVVADEVFRDFTLDGEDHPGFYGMSDLPVFVLDGFSKRLCLPQMKLGWIHVSGPEAWLGQAMERLELVSDTFLSAGAPVMNAAAKLLRLESAIQEKARDRMRKVYAIYRRVLEYEGSPHRVLSCRGGWTALVQSPRFDSEEELSVELLRQEGVFAHPGFFFDMEREAFFAFSLILEPETAEKAAISYLRFFEGKARG